MGGVLSTVERIAFGAVRLRRDGFHAAASTAAFPWRAKSLAAAPNAGDVGDDLSGAPAKMERGPDPSACRGRNHAGGIPDQGDAFHGPGRHNAAAGNASHPLGDGACVLESEKRLRFAKERAQMRQASAPAATRMEDRRSRRDPGQITRREFKIEKAMEETRIGPLQMVILDLDPVRKCWLRPSPKQRATLDCAPSARRICRAEMLTPENTQRSPCFSAPSNAVRHRICAPARIAS